MGTRITQPQDSPYKGSEKWALRGIAIKPYILTVKFFIHFKSALQVKQGSFFSQNNPLFKYNHS
ncbi:MAG: hypothetical protein A2157_13355 [Deltaproteobacteria bacterium RBG_16_47_11]|nr:MAG: hypothetical protein A2157_13355 [Deltaproteobacteria bacterium RBG_16_47_11]